MSDPQRELIQSRVWSTLWGIVENLLGTKIAKLEPIDYTDDTNVMIAFSTGEMFSREKFVCLDMGSGQVSQVKAQDLGNQSAEIVSKTEQKDIGAFGKWPGLYWIRQYKKMGGHFASPDPMLERTLLREKTELWEAFKEDPEANRQKLKEARDKYYQQVTYPKAMHRAMVWCLNP